MNDENRVFHFITVVTLQVNTIKDPVILQEYPVYTVLRHLNKTGTKF